MKRILLILAACACACACAGVASARLGSLGRNDTVVTNVTDVTPGNYETVSNRAMTASAYTDAALGAFAATGAVMRAEIYGTPTRWTDATGCVWSVVGVLTGVWTFYSDGTHEWADAQYYENDTWIAICDGYNAYADGGEDATSLDFLCYDNGARASATQTVEYVTKLIGRVALTNDIPRTAGDVGAYPAASGSALESGKQDRLPYPTNAIPFSAIDGAPSGGPEWTISVQDSDFIEFVTNGIARVRWWDYSYTDISDMSAWPDGAAMFVRFEKQQTITSWTVGNRIHLVGYCTWPTNNFQSVWWRSGTNIFVNVLLEE
jgi:hypothetical protein